MEEIENPELAARRMREIYRAKGYSKATFGLTPAQYKDFKKLSKPSDFVK